VTTTITSLLTTLQHAMMFFHIQQIYYICPNYSLFGLPLLLNNYSSLSHTWQYNCTVYTSGWCQCPVPWTIRYHFEWRHV